jgi:hypothetical protein
MKDLGHAPVLVMKPFCKECGRALDGEGQHIEGMTERYARESREEKAAEKAKGDAQFASAPKYDGAILWCMASKIVPRSAPFRCRNKPTRVLRDSMDHKPMVACTGCAHKLRLTRYRGWGGDPNPFMPDVEQKFVEMLP